MTSSKDQCYQVSVCVYFLPVLIGCWQYGVRSSKYNKTTNSQQIEKRCQQRLLIYCFRSGLGQTPVRHEVLRREEQRRCSGFLQGSELRPDKPDHPVNVNRHESGAPDRRLWAGHPRGVRRRYVRAYLLTFLSASNKTRRPFQSKAMRQPGGVGGK